MSRKCAYFWGAISLLSILLSIQAQAAPDPCNGRFELFDYDPILDINTPTDWQCENYTAVVPHFIPNPDEIREEQWLLDPCIGIFPYEGNYFLMLSSGDVNVQPPYAKVWQPITIETGDTLIGAYFFGTYDWLAEWNDYAEIKLVPTTDPNLQELSLVFIAVADVGSYSSMNGWKRFEKTFEANQAGNYDLVMDVHDVGDFRYNSYFAIDGLVLCHNASGGGDINRDCTTDFHDFAILAADWLCDCNDPNNYNDPNTNCRLETDLTGDGPVDINDLEIMSQHWLEGTKEY